MVKVRLSSPKFAEEEAYDDPGVEGVHKQFAKCHGRCITFMQRSRERDMGHYWARRRTNFEILRLYTKEADCCI